MPISRRGPPAQRRMLLRGVSVFLVAAILAASAPVGLVFVVALIVMGLCTSIMLVTAVPPLVIGWPTSKLPVTAVILNLCIFGAVAIGPTIGSLQVPGGLGGRCSGASRPWARRRCFSRPLGYRGGPAGCAGLLDGVLRRRAAAGRRPRAGVSI